MPTRLPILLAQIQAGSNSQKLRQTAIVSAFASSDFDKYKYLTRIDLALKPNSLQKARFEHSPLGNLLNKKQKNLIDGSKYNQNGNSRDNENGDSIDSTDSEYERLLDEVARLPFDRRQSSEDTFTTSLSRESFNDDNTTESSNDLVERLLILRDEIDDKKDNINKALKELNSSIEENQPNRQDSPEYDQSISDTFSSVIGTPRHRPPRTNQNTQSTQIDNNVRNQGVQKMPNQIDSQNSEEYDQSISDTSSSVIGTPRHRPPRTNQNTQGIQARPNQNTQGIQARPNQNMQGIQARRIKIRKVHKQDLIKIRKIYK